MNPKPVNERSDHDILVELHAAICGVNGQDGLLRSHNALKKDYYTFKRWVLCVFAFAVGSGIFGVGIYNLVGK